MKKGTFTVTIAAVDSEHPIENDGLCLFLRKICGLIKDGATSGKHTFEIPHSHMGESDAAEYDIAWAIVEG